MMPKRGAFRLSAVALLLVPMWALGQELDEESGYESSGTETVEQSGTDVSADEPSEYGSSDQEAVPGYDSPAEAQPAGKQPASVSGTVTSLENSAIIYFTQQVAIRLNLRRFGRFPLISYLRLSFFPAV